MTAYAESMSSITDEYVETYLEPERRAATETLERVIAMQRFNEAVERIRAAYEKPWFVEFRDSRDGGYDWVRLTRQDTVIAEGDGSSYLAQVVGDPSILRSFAMSDTGERVRVSLNLRFADREIDTQPIVEVLREADLLRVLAKQVLESLSTDEVDELVEGMRRG